MNTLIDLTGERFGRLVVLEKDKSEKTPNGNTVTMWKCKCDCGNETVVSSQKLRSGHTTSCGCMQGGKPKEDLTGRKFHKLMVVRYLNPEERTNKRNAWLCRCDCGNEIQTVRNKLVSGQTKSCGCMKAERISNINKKHKCNDRRLYSVYMAMRERTEKPSCSEYENYGGRGIKVCNEWLGELGFDVFAEWAYSTGYKTDAKQGEYTIDRMDVNGDYSPENCRWITNKEQQNNRRDNVIITYKGETHTMKEWSEILDIPYKFLNWRISAKTNNHKRTLAECIAEYEEYKLK